MPTLQQIKTYITSLPYPKRSDMQALHQFILKTMPKTKLWFLDGTDDKGKVVTNPNIGYGAYTMQYAGGKTRQFYQIGLSANTAGISVYIMGLANKKYLPDNYAATIGKASVTGYCIKFKQLKDIHLPVLEAAIKYGVAQSST